MKIIFALCLFIAFSIIAFADTPPKVDTKLTVEEASRLKQINDEFTRADLEEQLVKLKKELQQEKFARLLWELRAKHGCNDGSLNPSTGEFTCPPKTEAVSQKPEAKSEPKPKP